MARNRRAIKKFHLCFFNINLLKKHIKKILVSLMILLIFFNIHKFQSFYKKIRDSTATTYAFISFPAHWVQERYWRIKDYVSILNNDKKVYLENKSFKKELEDMNLLKAENKELKRMLAFKDNFYFEKVTGRIVLKSQENFYAQYLVNIGERDGVKEGNAVVSNNKLIGRVIDVGYNSSTIQFINDMESKIPVFILNTAYHGIAVRTNMENYLKLLYLPDEIDIEDDQDVLTSGEGNYMPYGIYVGKIINKDGEVYINIPTDILKKSMLISVLKSKDKVNNESKE
jgi:rod shape-determining protein MreC